MLEALMKKKNRRTVPLSVLIVIFIFAALICRLVYLQLFEGSYYHGLAEGNRLRAIPIAAMRGVMYDRNGQILVGSRPSFMVTYVPTKKGISDAELDSLAKLLNVPKEKLQEKIDKGKIPFELTIPPVISTRDIVTRVEERRNDLPGVSVDVQPIRYYPNNSMAAQVFGYVGQIDEEDMKRLQGRKVFPVSPRLAGLGWKPIMMICCAVKTVAVRLKSMPAVLPSRKWNAKIPYRDIISI